jgi:hypothetical protein
MGLDTCKVNCKEYFCPNKEVKLTHETFINPFFSNTNESVEIERDRSKDIFNLNDDNNYID